MFYKYFKIQTKDGKFVNYRPNRAQKKYHHTRTSRDIILKARQLGFSTKIKLDDLESILTKQDINCVTIAHTTPAASDILQKVTMAWENLPESFRSLYNERYKSKNALYLDEMRSGIKVTTSSRSGTVQRLHISEYGLMTKQQVEEIHTGSLPSVGKKGYVVIESTARGMNHFKDFWDDAVNGKNGFKPHFYNWTWIDDYQETPPESDDWRHDYIELAKQYNTIEDIQKRFNLSDAQFYWYYLMLRVQKEFMPQEYPTIPEEAFMTSGNTIFDLFQLQQLKLIQPLDKFEGVIKIYEEPIKGHNYTLGIDTAEGLQGDSTGISVINITTNDVVATFKSNTIQPHETGILAIKLAKYYNGAFIVPERNSSGLTTVTKIIESGYMRVYRNRTIDKISKKVRNEWGWRTTTTTRDLLIDDFVELVQSGEFGINCPDLKTEMTTFVRRDNGKREHDDGKHDDLLFATMLAWQGRKWAGASAILI